MGDQGAFLLPARSVIRRLARSFPKVDFPDDLGPQRKKMGDEAPFRFVAIREASFLFHSGGETSSWRATFLGTSSGENNYSRVSMNNSVTVENGADKQFEMSSLSWMAPLGWEPRSRVFQRQGSVLPTGATHQLRDGDAAQPRCLQKYGGLEEHGSAERVPIGLDPVVSTEHRRWWPRLDGL